MNVTISRYWDNPKINIVVDSDLISLSIGIEDFYVALLEEVGQIATTLTKKQMLDKLKKAGNIVVEKIKEESIKVI
jgi:hypothetical protein